MIAICALGAEHAYERRQTAERVQHMVRVSRDLFTALQEVRLLRGGINAGLQMPNPVTAPISRASQQRDLASQQALADAMTLMSGDPSPSARQAVADIRARDRDFLATRDQAMAAMKLPKAQRPPDMAARWIAADNALVAAAGGLAHDLSSEVSGDDPFVAEMMKVKQLVWWARDAAGADSMLVSAAQAMGGRLTPDQLQALAEQHGRSDEAWAQVRDEARMPTLPPQVEAAVGTANRVFYGDYNDLRDKIVAELAAGAPMTFTRQDEMTAAVRGLDSLMAVATAAFDASDAHARQELAAADRDLTLAVVLMLLSLGLGVAAFHFISRRVVQPIGRITDVMSEVASGELDNRIPYQDRGDEIGRLARALSVFRRNAMEKRRVELALNRSQVAVEAAEAASRLKSQFLANMSHEIRTPLNGVLGMVQVMEPEAETPLQRERLATIRDSGKALLQILNDVLDLSKIEAGEFDLHPEEFVVGELAQRTARPFPAPPKPRV
ncbi:MAG TPA: histidine kinase dimerization/phospho-acceptor domain-containing protein [Caulobacteraceae bacterium]